MFFFFQIKFNQSKCIDQFGLNEMTCCNPKLDLVEIENERMISINLFIAYFRSDLRKIHGILLYRSNKNRLCICIACTYP